MAIIKRGNGLVKWMTALAAMGGIGLASGGYIVNEITFRSELREAIPQVERNRVVNEAQSEQIKEIDRNLNKLTRNTCRLLIIIYAQKGWPIPEDCEHREE